MYTVEFFSSFFLVSPQTFFLSKNFNLRRRKLVSSFHLRLWECTDSHDQSQGYFFPRISILVLMKYSCQNELKSMKTHPAFLQTKLSEESCFRSCFPSS